MDQLIYIALLLIVTTGTSSAQVNRSPFNVFVGGQASYAMKGEPSLRVEQADDFRSGYSPAYGIGALVGVTYRMLEKTEVAVTLGVDAHHFSYDLISPPTFGEIAGRTVPGRTLTAYKGVGSSWFAELGASIDLGKSDWLPVLILRGSLRTWWAEHSNADAAYAAGYQLLEERSEAKYQAHYGLGFGVSPFSQNSQISIVYQRTFEPFEPLHNMLVLRQIFRLSENSNRVVCPKF